MQGLGHGIYVPPPLNVDDDDDAASDVSSPAGSAPGTPSSASTSPPLSRVSSAASLALSDDDEEDDNYDNDIIVVPKNWSDHAIDYLDGGENAIFAKIDSITPNCFLFIHNKIDDLGLYIENKLAPLVKDNNWLDKNGDGAWYKQFATFLYKLPLRVIRNILRLVYNIIKVALYATIHPLRALSKIPKLLVALVYQLTQPNVWSKIGVGIVGASLGQALVSGNPLSVITFGIGGAMLLGGLTFGAIKAAVTADEGEKWKTVKKALFSQVKDLPEAMLTGFVMGLILGGIQSSMQMQPHQYKITNMEEAQKAANQFVIDHKLPLNYKIDFVNPDTGTVSMVWVDDKGALSQLQLSYPELFPKGSIPLHLEVRLTPDAPGEVTTAFRNASYGLHRGPLEEIGLNSHTYFPAPEVAPLLTQNGAAIGVAAPIKPPVTFVRV